MEKFTASNGIEIEFTADGYLLGRRNERQQGASGLVTHATAGPEGIVALREFFRAERDAELGRWRWPESTDVVVRVNGPDPNTVEVYDEDSGLRAIISRGGLGFEEFEPYLMRAARAYFATHPEPEPRPWENAQEGEVWLLDLTASGESAWFVNGDYFQDTKTLANRIKGDKSFRAGRRIWPEGETTP